MAEKQIAINILFFNNRYDAIFLIYSIYMIYVV